MNLIAYSDSEESDNDAPQAPKPAVKPAPKPTFQKVVDRSNPGKIKLNLPTPRAEAGKDDIEAEAPPAKKARTGGGAFSGFNAMLPAPKKPKVDATTAISGKRGLGKSLGSGVNLRTGAEPAFQRAPKEEDYDENGDPIQKEESGPMQKEDFRKLFNLPPPKTETQTESVLKATPPEPPKPGPSAAQPASKPRFMPLSVARGKKKKPANRPAGAVPDDVKAALDSARERTVTEPKPTVKPKVSLFGVPQEENAGPATATSNEEYKPLLYGADDAEEDDTPGLDDAFNETHTYQTTPSSHPTAIAGPQGLNDLASELNLSEAERRRLFGRRGQGPDMSTANIIEFNTDTEYAHNERLRQQGETVQHNALKSISGTGKNSLRSLINVASTQKEALEEHFASGRRNKKEAGNKYGW